MNIFLTLAFLFFIGATLGWVLELLFRRFFSSANPERKWWKRARKHCRS